MRSSFLTSRTFTGKSPGTSANDHCTVFPSTSRPLAAFVK